MLGARHRNFACQEGADDHSCRQRHRRPDAKPGKRNAKERQRDASEQWREEGLVDVTALEVPCGIEEVQLVAVVAVESGERHHHGKRRGGDDQDSAVEGRQWWLRRHVARDFVGRRHTQDATSQAQKSINISRRRGPAGRGDGRIRRHPITLR